MDKTPILMIFNIIQNMIVEDLLSDHTNNVILKIKIRW